MNKKVLNGFVILILGMISFSSCSKDEEDSYLELKSFLAANSALSTNVHSTSIETLKRGLDLPYNNVDVSTSFIFNGNDFRLITTVDDCRIQQNSDDAIKLIQVYGSEPNQLGFNHIILLEKQEIVIEDNSGNEKVLYELRLNLNSEMFTLSMFDPFDGEILGCNQGYEDAESVNMKQEVEREFISIFFDFEDDRDDYYNQFDTYL